jgi:signal transduction histidine kinase
MPIETGLRVLLVEDDHAFATFLSTALSTDAGGIGLSTVGRLSTALDRVRTLDTDAILLDLNLPDSRGLATLEAMLPVAGRVPIVVLTGIDDTGLANDAVRLGAQDWLLKGQLDPQLIQRSLRYAVERKKLTDGLVRAQKLEVVGRLASGVAHEFNNVLTAIIGSSQLIELADEESARRGGLDLLRRAAHQGTALCRQLLSLARTPPAVDSVVCTSTLIDNATVLLQAVLPAAIELEIGAVADLPIRIDAGQFDQLLLNLALNARDAMTEGGVLRISVSGETGGPIDAAPGRFDSSDAPPAPEPAYAVVRVSDTGVGIDPLVVQRVFEPFFTTKADTGTGLGLAVCAAIAERFGGTIRVESQPGLGTTFFVRLPVAATPPSHTMARIQVGADGPQC